MGNKIDRREFLQVVGGGAAVLVVPGYLWGGEAPAKGSGGIELPGEWANPPAEFSQAPFWFWNDALTEEEIARQMADFRDHGVYAFTIHARAGLPRSIGWMSDAMIGYMRFAIEEAARRDMWVILYDEGMYPSGSSSGQVVAENSGYRTRALFAVDLDEAKAGTEVSGIRIGSDGEPALSEGQNLVAIVRRKSNGHRIAVVDRAASKGRSVIRGLHFLEDDPPRRSDHKEVRENAPPGADILNPASVECFIRLVYQRYYDEFREHFGKTVRAIFTDEPSLLARSAERGAVAGTTGIVEEVNRLLGYDFTEHLAALWYRDEPDAGTYRADYNRALRARLEETFYEPISRWCEGHGVALTGHPAGPDDIGQLRHFQMPGQDIVWRYIEPGKASALEGAQSTQAKCASSAMVHLGRRRNANECCGAYGHNFTFREMKWLTSWLIVRGCNLLIPHAFYYSIRGPRIDERPPDVGPNSPWWGQYKGFAEGCRRLCWLNTDSRAVCEVAILGLNDHLPWGAAKVCFENQIDFNYLEARHLWEDAEVSEEGIRIAGMHYKALVLEDEVPEKAREAVAKLEDAGRAIRWQSRMGESGLLERINGLVSRDVRLRPGSRGVRVRHVIKEGTHYYIVFNEGEDRASLRLETQGVGERFLLNAETSGHSALKSDALLSLEAHELVVVAKFAPGSKQWAKRLAVAGVANFHMVSEHLYRGAQPTAEGMRRLEQIGIKTVINLRSFHSDRQELEGTHLGSERIYMKTWHAEDEEVAKFLRIVTDPRRTPAFVHCQRGADRTGTMCAIYRVAVQGWSKEEAIAEMTGGGFAFFDGWQNLVNYIKNLDIERIKREAGLGG